MIEVLIYLVILATAVPVGYLLANLCSDELQKDRKYLLRISEILLILAFMALVLSLPASITLASIYLVFVFSILIIKGRTKSKKK
jgi:sugar phosphate permease